MKKVSIYRGFPHLKLQKSQKYGQTNAFPDSRICNTVTGYLYSIFFIKEVIFLNFKDINNKEELKKRFIL